MTKAQEKRLRAMVEKAEKHLREAAVSLEALSLTEPTGPMKSRATRHSRDLVKRISSATLALAKAKAVLGPAE